MFLGGSIIGDLAFSTMTPSYVNDIKHLSMRKGMFDYISVNKNVAKYPVTSTPPGVWEVTTLMMGDFDDTTSVGALDIDLAPITTILIKRREINSDSIDRSWVIIDHRDVTGLSFEEKLEAINAPRFDNMNRSHTTYEYAVIPAVGIDYVCVISGTVDSSFDGIFLVGADQMWGTLVTDGFINTVRNVQKSYLTTLNRAYPVAMSAAVVNYDSGTVTGEFIPFDSETCELVYDESIRIGYQKRFMDFLTDYKAKILKSLDGRMWLVDIAPSPSDSADGIYYRRQISFTFNEIGDLYSQEDLYYNKIYKIPKIYWGS